MIKLSLFICLPLFLTGLLPGTAKPEMAVEDTGFEEVEITGLFSVGGKPMVSLSIRNSSSFTLKIGQRSRGIKLLQVQGDDDPYVVLERNGQQGLVFLNKSRPSPANRVVGSDELEKRLDDTGMIRTMYAVGENEPFTGTRISYREDGSKASETAFVDGKENGMWIRYREDGLKYSETPFVDGKQHGTMIIYREDGSKREEYVFENNYQISSKIFNYYGYGLKRSETPFVDGKKHGTWIRYHKDGSKAMETLYENGKEISRKEF